MSLSKVILSVIGKLKHQQGGLEFVDQFTTVDNPYFEGPGDILISAIDILPTELGEWALRFDLHPPPNHILTIGIMQPPMRQVISLLLFILTFKAFYSRLAKVTRMI